MAALAGGGPAALAATGLSVSASTSGTSTSAQVKTGPHFFPSLTDTVAQRQALNPPAPPQCPTAVANALATASQGTVNNCHLPEPPATGAPVPGNMAYYGGPVQTVPHVYLVFWGWGESGAFPASDTCTPETLGEGTLPAVTVACDPDGAGKRMADFVSELGGTKWAGVQTQYYEVVNGQQIHITNPTAQLAGIWADDTNPTSAKITYTDMAKEAERAAAHFNVSGADLTNANFVIAQPANFSDPAAQSTGYCAFHDMTEPDLEGGIYNGITAGIAYTNMPYVLNQGAGCGQNLVNGGSAGRLDGFTIALGHEIEETVTDPGAEDVLPNGTQIGGWYDVLDSGENGDKCAYVGDDLGLTDPSGQPIPGAAGNITGNRGDQFPVQSLWSNAAAGGLGYCAGTGNDLPF